MVNVFIIFCVVIVSVWAGGKDLELLEAIHKVCETVKKGDKPLNMTWKCVHSRVYTTVGDAYKGTDECTKRMSWACHIAKQHMFDKGTLVLTSVACDAD